MEYGGSTPFWTPQFRTHEAARPTPKAECLTNAALDP